MIQRCSNKNNQATRNYLGRGITVCEKWKTFEGFFEDMGPRPEGMSLDRIDNNKGYYKENCRWATRIQQCNNRRSSRTIHAFGRSQTMAEWAREMGISTGTIWNRLKLGKAPELALSRKSLKSGRPVGGSK
jgi:hypothetical protein